MAKINTEDWLVYGFYSKVVKTTINKLSGSLFGSGLYY